MVWNLLGFTIILFILKHSITILLSDSNLFIRSGIVFAQAESVLSSSKLWIEEDSMSKIYKAVYHYDSYLLLLGKENY